MNFLQPERYYTILIQSTIGGSTIVFGAASKGIIKRDQQNNAVVCFSRV